jgi:hypothetical protein
MHFMTVNSKLEKNTFGGRRLARGGRQMRLEVGRWRQSPATLTLRAQQCVELTEGGTESGRPVRGRLAVAPPGR